MRLLDKLTDNPSQKYTVVTDAGDQVTLQLRYLATQQMWQFSVAWRDFALNGAEMVVSPNILYGYKNILPFGFAVFCNDDLDPCYLDDFVTGRISVYVLSADDLVTIENTLVA